MNKLPAALLLCLCPLQAGAVENMAPPSWTAQTCYIEGDWLYAAGKALGASDEKQGRALARAAALEELRKFLRTQDVAGLDTASHESFAQGDGRNFDVYVLLRTDYASAASFSHKNAETALLKLQQLEAAQKAELDRQQTLVVKMRRNEERLASLAQESEKIRARIAETSEKAAEHIAAGMTAAEVKRLLGDPTVSEHAEDRLFLNYGQYWVLLQSGVVSCLVNVSDFRGLKSTCLRKQLKPSKAFFSTDNSRPNVAPTGKRRR